MSFETEFQKDLQLLDDIKGMERKIRRGWARRIWVRPGPFGLSYCLTGAMNKQIYGASGPEIHPKRMIGERSQRRWLVLRELGFYGTDEAERWNDTRKRKEEVLALIETAKNRVLERVQEEQLRRTREAQAAAAEKQRKQDFVQEWLDKPREEEPLVVPEEWTQKGGTPLTTTPH